MHDPSLLTYERIRRDGVRLHLKSRLPITRMVPYRSRKMADVTRYDTAFIHTCLIPDQDFQQDGTAGCRRSPFF